MMPLSLFHTRPSSSQVKDENFNKDISSLENAFSRKDYDKIIEDPELFWLAFCKAFSQTDGEDSFRFKASLQGKTLIISGREHIISDVQKFVGEVRKFFVKGRIEKSSFVILPIKISNDYFIRGQIDEIDLTDWLSDRQIKLFETWFKCFIKPTMQIFCESIGAVCSDLIVSQKIITFEESGVQTENVNAFKIDWVSGDHFVYPIEAKAIPIRDDLQKSMYSMYQSQILCDLSLIAKDGVVKLHSIPLFTYGGEVIQKMLTCNMKEALENVVCFDKFSLNSVKAFVDFIYLGEKGLEPESILKGNVDLCELFQIANTYQVQALIDCCTNLFSLFYSVKDIEKIKYLAELYDNKHLKELYEYLCPKSSQTGFIKI